MTYSEHDRQRIAEKEYDPKLVEGSSVVITGDDNEKKTIGTVRKIIDDEVTGIIEEATYEKSHIDISGIGRNNSYDD